MKWLLMDDAVAELAATYRLQPSAEQLHDFQTRAAARERAPISRTAGSTAEIDVSGVLTETPNFWAALFGGNTAYRDIRAALAQADADPAISEIVLNIASPGGSVSGLFETIAAIEATSKPVRSRASLAASAAYALAAVTSRIDAVGPASSFGSIGVAASIQLDPSTVDIASTHAPNKRPDVTTEEGKAVVRAELDAIHELFAGAIARGRGVSVDVVNASFGRGSVLLSAAAKKANMIDSYPSQKTKPRARASASLEINVGIGLTAAPGSQLEQAERMLAELDASETQEQRAARLLAPEKPPEPPKPDLQTQIADRLDYLRGKSPKKLETSVARAVAVALGPQLKVTVR